MSFIGMALGVACLTAAMAVVSGYESALKSAVIDVFGHILVVRRSERPQNLEDILSKVKEVAPEARTFTPFLNLEGVLASGGKLAGVVVQGVDPKSVEKVLNIRGRLVQGEFSFDRKGEHPTALVGKALAKRFGLKVGDEFKVVLPSPSHSDSTEFSPKVETYRVGGMLDLGKAEYDERSIFTDLKSAQAFAGVGDGFTGIRIRVSKPDQAAAVSSRIARELGTQYWTMDWVEVNRNLFEAIKIERVAIFFVVLIMVVAASFNISSNLFVSVLQKYGDISILRAMGFSGRDITKVFIVQGLFFGVLGSLVGLVLGLLLCLGFVVVQRYVVLLPTEIYRISHVGVEIRLSDLASVIGAAIVICLLSTLIPARRGAKLDPVEGLRYE
jgi:lipoprotein-releasing system permease protein